MNVCRMDVILINLPVEREKMPCAGIETDSVTVIIDIENETAGCTEMALMADEKRREQRKYSIKYKCCDNRKNSKRVSFFC